MKKNNFLISTSTVISFSLLFSFSFHAASAAQIDHHDFLVEEGTDSDCHECHEVAGQSEGKKGSSDWAATTNHTLHPIHLPYPPAADTQKKGTRRRFRTQSEAQARGIRFQNDQITCLSCHNLNNTGKGHLTIDNTGSHLCMACHNL